MSSRGGIRWATAAAVCTVLVGCGTLWFQRTPPPSGLIAVLPIEPMPLRSEIEGRGEESDAERLAPDAGAAVTACVYGALAERSDFRFVPDLTATVALQRPAVSQATGRTERAVALGVETQATATLFGVVSRFRERIGTEYGAARPAAVSMDLQVVDVATGQIVWRGAFDETQQSLTGNLLKAWMFWRAGPHWFTARELACLGAGMLIEELRDAGALQATDEGR